MALSVADRDAESRGVYEGAISVAETAGDLEILVILLNNLAYAYSNAGEIDRSRSCRERGVTLADRMGDPAQLAVASAALGRDDFLLGSWVTAQAHTEHAVASARGLGLASWAFSPLVFLGQLNTAKGRWSEAALCLHEARVILDQSGNVPVSRYVRCLQAEVALLRSRPQEAIAFVEGMFEGSPLEAEHVTFVLPTLAWVYLEAGDTEQAEATIDEAVRRCRSDPDHVDLADALRIAGMVASGKEQWDSAQAYFDEALTLTQAMKYPYAGARALYEYGLMLARRGMSSEGRDRLEAAAAIFERLGATPYIERTRRALA